MARSKRCFIALQSGLESSTNNPIIVERITGSSVAIRHVAKSQPDSRLASTEACRPRRGAGCLRAFFAEVFTGASLTEAFLAAFFADVFAGAFFAGTFFADVFAGTFFAGAFFAETCVFEEAFAAGAAFLVADRPDEAFFALGVEVDFLVPVGLSLATSPPPDR